MRCSALGKMAAAAVVGAGRAGEMKQGGGGGVSGRRQMADGRWWWAFCWRGKLGELSEVVSDYLYRATTSRGR